jgi:hypothetical protein
MPHLDATTLETDPDGCAFLRSVLSPGRVEPKDVQLPHRPALQRSSVVAHLGRELRSTYEGLMNEGVPEHLAEAVEKLEAAMG